jgi:poly [ADP-ribose] polymerase
MANFILDTKEKVKQKIEMLEALTDIEIATKILEEGEDEETDTDSVYDIHYKKLKCTIDPMDKKVSF